MSRASHALVTAALASLLVACVPERPRTVALYPTSGAPPARRLQVDTRDDRHAIVVSRGVAFGVQVWDDCRADPNGRATRPEDTAPKLTIADPKLLGVFGLSRDATGRAWVLFGVQAGRTTLTLEAACAKQTYDVEIVPP